VGDRVVLFAVMPGLVPGIHVVGNFRERKTWMAEHRLAQVTPFF
jgi:hypothetical protein